MIKANDLTGRAIVSGATGQTGYKAVSPIVDASRLAVSHIAVVQDGTGAFLETLILPLDRIDRIEPDAVTVRQVGGQPLFLSEEGESSRVQVNLLGMKVISRMGNLLGTVTDFLFSQLSGQLLVVYIQKGEEEILIRVDEAFSILEDVIISDLGKRLLPEEIEKLIPPDVPAAEEIKAPPPPPPVPLPLIKETPEPVREVKAPVPEKALKEDRVKEEKPPKPKKVKKEKTVREKKQKPAKTKKVKEARKKGRAKKGRDADEGNHEFQLFIEELEKEGIGDRVTPAEVKAAVKPPPSEPDPEPLLLNGSGKNMLRRYLGSVC